MLRATFKGLLARRTRLIMSALAVILGVAFLSGTMIFGDTLRSTFDGIMAGSTSDVVVRQEDSNLTTGPVGGVTISEEDVARIAEVDGVARADGNVGDSFTTFLDDDGQAITGGGAPGIAFNWTEAPNMEGAQSFVWVEGRAPETEGEVGVDEVTAETGSFAIGDEVELVTTGDHPRISAEIVGIGRYTAGGIAGATLAVFDTRTAQKYYLGGERAFVDVSVTAEEGLSQAEVRDRVAEVVPDGYEAVTGEDQAADASEAIASQLGFLNNFLLLFAAIALFVGAFLIINTFSILVAQRGRELALFRALGAQRRQITVSVLVEALVVGLVGSTLGLGLGVLLAVGISWLMTLIGLNISTSSLEFSARTVLVAYVVGVLVTVLAAWIPARRASKVPPMAALREDVVVEEGSMRSRVVIGAMIAVLGAVSLGLGLFSEIDNALYLVGAGMFGVMLGAAMTSPIIGRPFLALSGWVVDRTSGMVGRMATQNSVRNPRRTAATASALMIGVTLVTTMSIFGESAKASLEDEVEQGMIADYVVSQATGMPFATSITDDLRAVDGVAEVSTVRYAIGMELDGEPMLPDAVDPETFGDYTDMEGVEGADRPADGTVLVSAEQRDDRGLALGDTLIFTYGPSELPLEVAGFFEEIPALQGPAFIVTHDDIASVGAPETDNIAYAVLEDDADRSAVRAEIDEVLTQMPLLTASDRVEFAERQNAQFDQLLAIVYALLGLAIVIAVLGIVNTLGLSVIERTREFGLLRAIGLSRPQLRRMVTVESVIIALLGAVLGTGLGLIFGVALQQALKDDGFGILSIPWLQIVLTLVAAALVGVLAAAVPARRASHLQILEAIYTD